MLFYLTFNYNFKPLIKKLHKIKTLNDFIDIIFNIDLNVI